MALSTSPVAEDGGRVRRGWRWFTAFRRTRPFWGGLWLLLGGYVVIDFASSSIGFAVQGGWSASSGYILGGAMVLFGLVAWFTPHYSGLVGLLGVLTALAAFVGSNLGGFLIGTLLGIVGGSMVWAWGEKKPRARGRRARSPEDEERPVPTTSTTGEVADDDRPDA
ncbi:hypothetical protein JL108_01625 [Aeromicrobium sp. YIM 150415]|uniref:DUF6114 domain-containing protein n=1 Tax=Aeromicrobium sp. YIM 150415 TaxID=2803912 RepID=UPI001963A316|nr:DUF6114 domain-containing protein [Aeromicrobium sp. YIM 150415]MBM9462127.1 hypothetical protein [Aeromicrobium sp. YIM 150415]